MAATQDIFSSKTMRTEPYSATRQKKVSVKSQLEGLCDTKFRKLARKLAIIYATEFQRFSSANILTSPIIKDVEDVQRKFSACISQATETTVRNIHRVTRKLDKGSNRDMVSIYEHRWQTLKDQQNRYWSKQVLYCCEFVSCGRQVEKLRNVLREIIRERFSGNGTRSTQEIIDLRHNFYELINESLNIIANDHQALDVNEKLKALYTECITVNLIDFSDAEAQRVCARTLEEHRQISKFPHVETETAQSSKTLANDLKAVGKKMSQLLLNVQKEAYYSDRMQSLSTCLSLIDSYSCHLFAGIECFDEEVALEVIAKTESAVITHYGNDVELLGKQLAHTYTRTVITNTFQALQNEWETKNSVMARFKEHYDIEVMWEYFVMVLSGEKSTKLFAFLLKRKMANCLKWAFETEMAFFIVAEIKKLDWLYDEQSTGRLMDLHLLDLVNADNKERLVHLITSPTDLLAVVIECVVRNLMPTGSKWQLFVNTVKESIESSAKETLSEARSLATKFLDRLVFNFSARFAGDVLNREFKMDVKKEFKDLDKEAEFLSVCQFELFETIDEQVCPIDEPGFSERICRRVMDRLRAEDSSTGMPRCQHFCPMCRSLCIREAGHDIEQQKHDAIHQPAGLGGTCDAHSKALDWKLCIEYEDDARLFVSNGAADHHHHREGYSFRDWNTAFRDWEKPHFFRDWPLRELILYKYHEEFAKFFDCKPCESMPKFYKRDLNKVRDALNDSTTDYP